MDTLLMAAKPHAIEEAARLLKNGQVVAIPTETVYGLAANALDSKAVSRIFEAKGRPQDNPLIVHIADMEMLSSVAREVTEDAKKLAEAFWPGPLTLVLPRSDKLAREVSAGLDTVGVRMPAHKEGRAVIRAAGVPLAAPSANISGSPSPTTARHVMADMNSRIPMVLDGGGSVVGVESTVLSLVGEPVVLRPGFVTAEEISQVLGRPVLVSAAAMKPLDSGETPQSPGMKYRHYAPNAELFLVKGSFDRFAQLVAEKLDLGVWALCFAGEAARLAVPALSYGKADDPASQAAGLFSALRMLDDNEATTVYVRSPEPVGIGLAVYNRLLRAASFRVLEV